MPTNVNLQKIIINSIPTKEIYNQMKTQGLLEPNQLYLVEEDPSVADMSKSVYDANGVVQNAGGIVEYVAANGGKIDVIKINGTSVPIVDKAVDIDIPTELSELTDDATHRVVTDTEKATWNAKGSYSKPSGGIPKSDLDSGVQGSLSKADSALQSFTEADPTVPDWAKQPNKPSYIALEVGADPSGTAVAAVLAHDADANAHEELFADCLKASDQEPSTPASVNADTLESHPASYFQPTITANGILKGNGSGDISAAVAGTDYAAMTNLHGRNLLDNPWFTVDQRQGFFAPIGIEYYDVWGGSVTGTTTQAYVATHAIGGYSDQYQIVVNGQVKYVVFGSLRRGYIGSGYCVDRWVGGSEVTIDQSGSLIFSATSDYILQRLEDKLKAMLVGKRLTASILFNDGTIEAGDQVYTGNDGEQTYFFVGTYFQGVKHPNGDILFWCANPAKQVKAVKLELGSVSTLANDAPPNYAEELLKCQRYFEVFQNISVQFGIKQGSTIFSSSLQFAEKRVAPSISFIKVDGHDAIVENIKFLDYGTDFTVVNNRKKSVDFSTTDTSIESMTMSFSIMLSADL